MSPFAETHLREAAALYRRRQQLLSAAASPRMTLQSLDLRLLANLDGACLGEPQQPEATQKAPAFFVHAWCGLACHAEDTLMALDQCYAELDAAQQQALSQAVTLTSGLPACPLQTPALAALLLPADAISVASLEAALGAADDGLAAVLLRQLDGRADADRSLLRRFYGRRDLPAARGAAVQAGLIRHDQDARDHVDALPPGPKTALLCADNGLAADSLLARAFTGTGEAARIILEALHDIARCEEAARAWFWLTGQSLPRRARLQAVGEPADSAAGSIPDAGVAAGWWQQQPASGDQRYFFGEWRDDAGLDRLAANWAGQLAELVALQKSLHRGYRVEPASGFCLPALNHETLAHA
ncbi:MAG: hypothetical protein R3292_11740 [Alcanivorax sp.]|nr:hypothetical protein [Alcanivorax sp.]